MGKKIICFYLGPSGNFNGKDYSTKKLIYGSELALIGLSIQLAKHYDVYVFGDKCLDELQQDGVHYLNSDKLSKFLDDNLVDIMIISRYINYFIKYKVTAKQTYIWIHDTVFHPAYKGQEFEENGKYLINNVIDKVTGIVALTNWHKNFLIKYYNLDKNKIIIIGNGLIGENFNNNDNIKKIKNRFIYTSSPNRGLEQLVEYFHEIKKKVSDATLHIYRGLDDFDSSTSKILEDIQKYKYIKFMGKFDQKALAIEMMKSEFWLYPTKFTETFCMSGMEALMAGCMCITSDLAALHDTIGERGILLKSPIYSHEYKKECIEQVLNMINNEDERKKYIKKGIEWSKLQTWECKTLEWINLFGDTVEELKNRSNTSTNNIEKIPSKSNITKEINLDGYTFYKKLDSIGNDIEFIGGKSINELKNICDNNENCIAFNTIGWMKNKIQLIENLTVVNWFKETDGIYVHNERYKKLFTPKEILNINNIVNYESFNVIKIDTHIINLERRPDRWNTMITKLNNVGITNYKRFNAIDGKQFKMEETILDLFKVDNPFIPKRAFGHHNYNKAVIGTALSHYNIWLELSKSNKSNNECILILEDDVNFTNDFIVKWEKLYNSIKDNDEWDTLFLGFTDYVDKYGDYNITPDIKKLISTKRINGAGLFAYCIRKKGAIKLIETVKKYRIQQPIDHFVIDQFDTVYAIKAHPHIITSPVYGTETFDTDIQNTTETLIT